MEVLQTCLTVKLNFCLLLNTVVIAVISDISALHFIHHLFLCFPNPFLQCDVSVKYQYFTEHCPALLYA